MASYALLIGTKGGKRELVADGDPRDIRREFKTAKDGKGFDQLEVVESGVGRTRRRTFKKQASQPAKKTAKKAAKE